MRREKKEIQSKMRKVNLSYLYLIDSFLEFNKKNYFRRNVKNKYIIDRKIYKF